MALAETVFRKVHKLGLIPKVIRLLPVISFLLAVASVAWMLVLPLEGQYRNSYISENALMPSQVTSYFRESEWNIVRGYREEVVKLKDEPIAVRNKQIEQWLTGFGLLNTYHDNGVTNDTLYSIMHAPRGDDTEAMVLTVPWITSDREYNEGGIAIAMALARYFSRASIWSKNIIFVFPEDAHYSLRSWVEAYHTTLENTAGSIDAAIVIEYGDNGDYFDYYEMSYEGLNGQLPNLDLLNTANLIAHHEGIGSSIQGTPGDELKVNTYFTRLRTLVRGILSLTVSGLKRNTPGCEAFSGWQIQAFTIKARGSTGPSDVTQFARIVDSTFRSVNNLLEKFHQSFFFYLMLSPKHFVSIGTYLPAAVLISVAFATSALGALLNSGIDTEGFYANLARLLTTFTAIESGAVLLSQLLPYIVKRADNSDETVLLVLYGFIGLAVVIAGLPLFEIKKYRLNKTIAYGLISLALFFISMLIVTLLIVNFSLALLIGLLSLPLTFVQPLLRKSNTLKVINEEQEQEKPAIGGTKKDPMTKLINYVHNNKPTLQIVLSLLVSNPFFVIFLVGNYFDSEKESVLLMKGLLTSWDELQCWTWFVVILGWFPAWLSVGLGAGFGDFVDYEHVVKQLKSE